MQYIAISKGKENTYNTHLHWWLCLAVMHLYIGLSQIRPCSDHAVVYSLICAYNDVFQAALKPFYMLEPGGNYVDMSASFPAVQIVPGGDRVESKCITYYSRITFYVLSMWRG